MKHNPHNIEFRNGKSKSVFAMVRGWVTEDNRIHFEVLECEGQDDELFPAYWALPYELRERFIEALKLGLRTIGNDF